MCIGRPIRAIATAGAGLSRFICLNLKAWATCHRGNCSRQLKSLGFSLDIKADDMIEATCPKCHTVNQGRRRVDGSLERLCHDCRCRFYVERRRSNKDSPARPPRPRFANQRHRRLPSTICSGIHSRGRIPDTGLDNSDEYCSARTGVCGCLPCYRLEPICRISISCAELLGQAVRCPGASFCRRSRANLPRVAILLRNKRRGASAAAKVGHFLTARFAWLAPGRWLFCYHGTLLVLDIPRPIASRRGEFCHATSRNVVDHRGAS